MTRSGDLDYTDYQGKTVDIITNKQIRKMISLKGWVPLYVCTTVTGNLLVIMNSDNDKSTKVVRYSSSTEIQSIQFNDKGQPLYSSGDIKYISENRNRDICVSDCDAGAIVVVNQVDKLRFTYTGPPSLLGTFHVRGVTIHIHSRTLNADCWLSHVHITDRKGQFISHINYHWLKDPWFISSDTRERQPLCC